MLEQRTQVRWAAVLPGASDSVSVAPELSAAGCGIDPGQFGVIVVLNVIIGTIAPLMGVVLFVVTGIAYI